MISKKALSILIGNPISVLSEGNNTIFYGNGLTTMLPISKYEVAHRCKVEATKQRYGIISGYNIEGRGIANIFYGKDSKKFNHLKATTEADAVLMAFSLLVKEGFIK